MLIASLTSLIDSRGTELEHAARNVESSNRRRQEEVKANGHTLQTLMDLMENRRNGHINRFLLTEKARNQVSYYMDTSVDSESDCSCVESSDVRDGRNLKPGKGSRRCAKRICRRCLHPLPERTFVHSSARSCV